MSQHRDFPEHAAELYAVWRPDMIQTIVLDLDGPILDGKVRHYTCYDQILRKHSYSSINQDTYWQMKRDRVDLRQQLAASGAEAIYENFKQSWLDLIEAPELLVLDRVQPGAIEKLRRWRDHGMQLALVTQRRSPKHLQTQLANLGLDILLDHIVVCKHNEGSLGKVQQLRNTVTEISPFNCLWVGDSEVDIEAARTFGCPVWAVACGVRTESYLASLSPDFVSPDITYVNLR